MSADYGNVLNYIDLFSILYLLWPPAKKLREKEVSDGHDTGCGRGSKQQHIGVTRETFDTTF